MTISLLVLSSTKLDGELTAAIGELRLRQKWGWAIRRVARHISIV